MHPFRNEGSGTWRGERDDDDARRRRADDPHGYGEGRYGQSGGAAHDYGEGRYEGRQRHDSDVRGQGYYGNREGRGEAGQQSGRRAPWDDDNAWRGSDRGQGGNVRDEWGYGGGAGGGGSGGGSGAESGQGRRGTSGRQGGMASGRGGYEEGYGISDYASPGAQTQRVRSGMSPTSPYGRDSGWGDDESGRTGMSERPGEARRRAGDGGRQPPGSGGMGASGESVFGEMRRGRDRVGPKGYQRSDERIREEICERLAHARHVEVQDIEVEVEAGVVRLSGNVQDRRQKYSIEEIVDDVFGVREIHNGIRMGSPGAFGVSGISEGVEAKRGASSASGTAGGQGHVSGVSSSGSATGSSASSYGGGIETGSGGPGAGRDSTGGTPRN